MLALSNSSATVLGVDTDTDFTAYSLPYYLIFDQVLESVIGATWMNNPEEFGAVLNGDQLIARPVLNIEAGEINFDPLTGMLVRPNGFPEGMADARVVRPYHSWSQRYYPMLYGMLSFTSNYSLQFVDNNHIFRMGTGEEVVPGEGFEVVTCSDPILGHSYGAFARTELVPRQSTAYEMIMECNELVDLYETDIFNRPTRAGNLSNHIERMNMMRGLYNVFGSIF